MREAWYSRYAWIVFLVVSLTGLVMAGTLLSDPLRGAAMLANTGHPVPEGVLTDAAGTDFLSFLLRWAGTVLVGSNLITAVVAATAFRRGAAWAWWAFWYWPLMFAVHFVTYGPGPMKGVQVVWLLLTIGALAASYRKAHRSAAVSAPTAAA